ncbi:putative metalloprotease CJM1_0395 family protein [Roseibium sp.]|uniref:putative metalloprotease CJM1_0395 family protein n=1 Tax=Roseibium sp. TaxID=1936156 RepID=UPI003D107E44
MIGALLSNTPANLLRSSGVAGDAAPGSEGTAQNRDSSAVRDSQASPRAVAVRAGTAPVLTPQAILALQETDETDAAARRRSQADPSGDGRQSSTESDQQQAQQSGEVQSTVAAQPGGTQLSANPASSAEDTSQQTETDDDADGDDLTEAEEKQVQELKQRDREVRAHEQAHARVGGAYASAPTYTFQQGPDGKRYAVGGEVQIDTSTERTPEATIRKMRVVISAALAPAEPSGQDLRVAQLARSQLSEAQAELRQQKLEELRGDDTEESSEVSGAENRSVGRTDPSENGTDANEASSSSAAESGGQDDGGSSSRNRPDTSAIEAYQAALDRVNDLQQAAGSLFA